MFCLGILPLVLIDCCFILSDLMPKGALLENKGDRIVLAIMFSVYLVSMIIAMYPGREDPSATESNHFYAHDDNWTDKH